MQRQRAFQRTSALAVTTSEDFMSQPDLMFTMFFPQTVYCGFSLRKRLAAICSGRVPGACPPCVRLVSAACPPCWLWPRLHSLSATCPPSVRLVLLALAAPPVLVRHLSALCPPCVALAAPPLLVRHLFPTCPPLLPRLSATCPPCVQCVVGFGRASRPCPPLVRFVSATCPPCVLALAPLVRCMSALCSWPWPLLQSLSATCPPGVCLKCLPT